MHGLDGCWKFGYDLKIAEGVDVGDAHQGISYYGNMSYGTDTFEIDSYDEGYDDDQSSHRYTCQWLSQSVSDDALLSLPLTLQLFWLETKMSVVILKRD